MSPELHRCGVTVTDSLWLFPNWNRDSDNCGQSHGERPSHSFQPRTGRSKEIRIECSADACHSGLFVLPTSEASEHARAGLRTRTRPRGPARRRCWPGELEPPEAPTASGPTSTRAARRAGLEEPPAHRAGRLNARTGGGPVAIRVDSLKGSGPGGWGPLTERSRPGAQGLNPSTARIAPACWTSDSKDLHSPPGPPGLAAARRAPAQLTDWAAGPAAIRRVTALARCDQCAAVLWHRARAPVHRHWPSDRPRGPTG